MNEDVFGNFETDRCKIPNSQDSCFDHFVGNCLCHLCRGGDDSQMNAHATGEVSKLLQRKDCLVVDLLADFFRVAVESRDDLEAEAGKALVPKQGGSQVSGPNKEGLIDVIPSQEALDRMNQLGDGIAGLRLANDARVLQVFPDLDRHAVEVPADNAAGDLVDALGFELHQIVMVLWEPAETRLGNRGRSLLFGRRFIR